MTRTRMQWLSPSCENLQFQERNIFTYIRASCIFFLFVNSKRNKTWSPCLYSLVKTLAKFVRILEQKSFDCVSGFHWSALEFSQAFALVFTRLWRHGKHVLYLKWRTEIKIERATTQIQETVEKIKKFNVQATEITINSRSLRSIFYNNKLADTVIFCGF